MRADSILLPALVISGAGNLYLSGQLKSLKAAEDIRWRKLGRLESTTMLYLAKNHPTYSHNKNEEEFQMFQIPFLTPAQPIKIKAPWSNRSKICAGVALAATAGAGASIFCDIRDAKAEIEAQGIAAESLLGEDTAVAAMTAAGTSADAL